MAHLRGAGGNVGVIAEEVDVMGAATKRNKGTEVLVGPPGFLFALSLLSMLVSGLVIASMNLLL